MVFTHAVNGRSTNIPTGAAPPKPSLLHAGAPPPSHYRAASMFLPCIDGHERGQSSDHRHHVPTARTVHSDEGRQYPENSPSTHLGPGTTTCCNQHSNWNTNCHKNTGKGHKLTEALGKLDRYLQRSKPAKCSSTFLANKHSRLLRLPRFRWRCLTSQ